MAGPGTSVLNAQTPESTERQAALEQLFDAFRIPLSRYFARRVRNESEIEDLVQETFERLIKRGGVDQLAHLGGYVFTTAASVFSDRLRSRRTRHADAHDEFDESADSGVDFSPEHVLLQRERLARATAALLELPQRTRTVFVLRRLEGMRYLEVARQLGISVSAVEKHMQRAVAHLADSIDRE
jgi:RNA polymerase sigma factor (sigma-70 family)